MTPLKQEIANRIKKILELSKRGVDGEKIAATAMLQKMLDKYGVTLGEIMADEPRCREFKYRSTEEASLIIQLAAKVLNVSHVSYKQSTRLRRILIELSDYDYIRYCEYWEAYLPVFRKALKQAKERFVSAFFYKHDIFSDAPSEGSSKEKPLSFAEVMAMSAIVDTLDTIEIQKKLA